MEKIREEDKNIITKNMQGRKFDVQNCLAVSHRCKWGHPQVVLARPIFTNGTPCPTLFWLVCPYLEKECGKLESNSGVVEIEKIFKAREKETATLHEEYKNLRTKVAKENIPNWDNLDEKLKASNRGIGGINTKVCPTAAKCLHLQLATMLGMGHHTAEDWFREKITDFSCKECRCSKSNDD